MLQKAQKLLKFDVEFLGVDKLLLPSAQCTENSEIVIFRGT